MNKKVCWLCIVWAFILFGAAGAQAQVRELQLNQPASGELTSGTQRDFYRVQVEANQHLVIFVQKPSGWDSAVYVRYESLTGEPVAEEQTWPDDDDSILEIPRTQAGSYYIEVTSDWTGDIGEYTILATLSEDVPLLSLGVAQVGKLISSAQRDLYRVQVEANQHLVIFVQKPSGWDSAVYVRYESLTGEPVAEEQTWPDDDDSILEIPRTQAGSYYIEVTSDWTGDIGEYTILATLAGGVPPTTLELGETLTDSITSGGWRDYEIDTFENENLLIILEPSSDVSLELYGKYNKAPARNDHDYSTMKRNTLGRYELLIPNTQAGTYYISVYGRGFTDYSIKAITVEHHICDIYPGILPNSDKVTIHIKGIGFTNEMRVELRSESAYIPAETVICSSPQMAIAHFNLTDAPLGLYNISVMWPDGDEKVIEKAVEVQELSGGMLYSFPDVDIDKGESLTYDISIPTIKNLFVTLQKTTLVSYGNSWHGELSLIHNGEEIAKDSGSHDLILHIPDPEPGSYTIIITASKAGKGILNVWSSLPGLSLGDWTVGKVYCSYGSVWYQLEVPPGQAALYFEAEAMGLWSHFDIYYNEYGSNNHWVSRQGTRTSMEIPDPEAGTYIVQFMDSAMLWENHHWSENQTRDVLIKADVTPQTEPLPEYSPIISDLSTNKGGNTGIVSIKITGGWLDSNATVSLNRSGYEDIVAQHVEGSSDGKTMWATFDLKDREPGEWNLTVTNPDGQTVTAPTPFIIEEGGKSELWVDIIGRGEIRAGRDNNYVIRFGNRGTVRAYDCLIPIGLSPGCSFKIGPSFDFLSSEDNSLVGIYTPILRANEVRTMNLILKCGNTESVELSYGIMSLPEELRPPKIIEPTNKLFLNNVEIQKRARGTYYPPDTVPDAPGVFVFRRIGGVGGAFGMHVGIYVGNGKVIELSTRDQPKDKYVIRRIPFSQFKQDGEYLGGATYPGFTKEHGEIIAERAKKRVTDPPEPPETGDYSLIPLKEGCKNCNSFIYEVASDYLRKVPEIDDKFYVNPGNLFEILTGNEIWTVQDILPYIVGKWFGFGAGFGIEIFKELFPGVLGLPLPISVVHSSTPEDKYGPTGFDLPDTAINDHVVPPDQNFYYKVDFWNKETATAPACDVFVKDQLDTDFDWNTFRFEEIGFLKWTVELEPCQYFNVNVDMRPDEDLIVNVEGTFDPETGKIYWTFRSLDPETMDTPEDPMAGFLPPITESGNEIGWVSFSVDPEADLPDGTEISNQAFVKFDVGDFHPAPKEGPFVNTIMSCLPGDANGDGSINVQDVICIINVILDTGTASGNPDCNNDGSVNVQDVICVINKILGG